jgi:hypothetical protein
VAVVDWTFSYSRATAANERPTDGQQLAGQHLSGKFSFTLAENHTSVILPFFPFLLLPVN